MSEEREELRATLDAQDQFVRSSELQQQQLRNEVARLNQALQAKEHIIRYTLLKCSCLAEICFRMFATEYVLHTVLCTSLKEMQITSIN